MKLSAAAALLSLAIVAGCGAATQAVGPASAGAASAPAGEPPQPPPATSGEATAAPSAQGGDAQTTPGSAAPADGSSPGASAVPADAKVDITRTFFKVWKDAAGGHLEAVIEVRNSGGQPADIHSGDQSYTLYAKDGTVLKTGTISYSFPQVLAPGQTGYYIEGDFLDSGTKIADVGKFDPSLSFRGVTSVPAAWDISKVKFGKDDLFGGLSVTGVAKNTDTQDATMGVVGIVVFDAGGNIIGGLVDNSNVMQLRAGQAKGFSTQYPGTPPMSPSAVKSYKAFGLDYQFFPN